MPSIDWNDLRYVLAVARNKAVAPAARTLRVNETTVSRRIARAELALRSKLFERIDGRCLPTEAAIHLIEHAERMEAEAAAIVELTAGVDAEASGTVRVTSIPLIITRLLLPAARELTDHYPKLRLEVIADPRNLSIMQRDADIALRLARPQREQMAVARRIVNLTYAVYGPSRASPTRLPWITYDDGMSALPHVAWINRALKQEGARAALTVNDSEVALHAIKAGIGKSLLPCVIGDREPGIKRLSGESPVLDRECWLLVNPSLRHLARIKAVIAWIEGVLPKHGANRRVGTT